MSPSWSGCVNIRRINKWRRFCIPTSTCRVVPEDGSFVIVFLEDGHTGYQLELTWLRDRREPYNLGDNEFHLAFRVEDKAAAHALHESMGCICYENPAMDLYFIEDPDGYWLEILDR